MKNIIVTILDCTKKYKCDVQIPCDQTIEMFMKDLIETINQYFKKNVVSNNEIKLFSSRLERILDNTKTIVENGIINGDYIYFVEE